MACQGGGFRGLSHFYESAGVMEPSIADFRMQIADFSEELNVESLSKIYNLQSEIWNPLNSDLALRTRDKHCLLDSALLKVYHLLNIALYEPGYFKPEKGNHERVHSTP